MSPLVAQAKSFALRINPPPPPEPVKPKIEPKPAPTPAQASTQPAQPPVPKVQASVKFDLLATVRYETAPEKSLALVSTGSKLEWFRQGEKVGQHEIKEIRDGSVIFTQAGGKPQEIFVPAKTEVKSLLKNEQKAVSAVRGPTGIQDTPAAGPNGMQDQPGVADAEAVRAARTRETAVSTRSTVDARIQRVRSAPPVPTVEEQKASIESSILGIHEIMARQDDNLSEEERRQENQMWAELLQALNQEKENLEKAAQTKPSESVPDNLPGRSDSQETTAAAAEKNQDAPAVPQPAASSSAQTPPAEGPAEPNQTG
ncbi:MAG TPA: hypothetical protein PK052_00815 [Anaerohalosphaeraceae bacterium]|nr:hypothetical protein [Phycisphaerae bacterium]HOK94814.1 hypothetical protein [Anaerohalosphaeraceae bacterium]HOL30497.1 hypothetical protein [Anaerohalosphaeraceae bacterium]HOM75766.1 hypothetical protein [Anaerohalosphaeraceae bacterium]HPC63943.1 hypothetical protein [Anaerohalosphaeraceae bacterium]